MLSLWEYQWKKPWENKNIYRWLYCIPNIKLKIMLYEPFMLNMVWKSIERFGNLSLEKYGILKWKICRMHIPHYWRWFLMCSADLPSRDDRCVRQEEHAQSCLLHSRAEVWIIITFCVLLQIEVVLLTIPCSLISCVSLFLFRLGLAPQIHDLCGKVKFTGDAHIRAVCF